MAVCVSSSSCAARVKLRCRDAASKASRLCKEGMYGLIRRQAKQVRQERHCSSFLSHTAFSCGAPFTKRRKKTWAEKTATSSNKREFQYWMMVCSRESRK